MSSTAFGATKNACARFAAGDTHEMMNAEFGATKTAKVNGTILTYREEGEGEPVVFVHGGLSDLRIWQQQLPEVGRSYRAIAYSRRFARPNEDIDREAADPILPHVEDLVAFLREIDAAPAHLVGNSLGAAISLHTAVRHPEVVRSLVLEEPPVPQLFRLSMPPRAMELLRVFVTQPLTTITMLRFLAGTLVPSRKAFERGEDEQGLRIFLQGVLGKESYERLAEVSKQRARENVNTMRAEMLRPPGHPPLSEDDVRAIRAPTLLVTGQMSPPVVIPLTDRLEELLPIVERVEIPDASHAMHEENAPAVNEAIIAFFRNAG